MKKKNNIKKNKDLNLRIITSIAMILIILPFFILAGLTKSDVIPWEYNYFFEFILMIVFIYGIYESINFCKTNESSELGVVWRTIIASFLFGIVLLYFQINFLKFSNKPSTIDLSDIFYQKFKEIILLYITSTIIWFSTNATSEIDYKDIAIPFVMISMLMFYFMSITILTIDYGFQTFFIFTLSIIMTDVFAYLGGKKFGKTKAFPKVSPNKTVEGLLTGIFSALLFSIIFFFAIIYTLQNTRLELDIKISLILIVIPFTILISPLGDLNFSKIKRSYNKKDFSHIIPGHGGLFDRIDSHIVAITLSTALLILLMTI